MLIVGLTGGIASGKSTVAGHLEKLGAVVIDADRLAHEAMAPGMEVNRSVADCFGSAVVAKDGSIDRRRLAEIVFSDENELERLNQLVHPAVIERVRRITEDWRRSAPAQISVVQVPLLIEAGMVDMFDLIAIVVSTPERQLERLMASGLTEGEALARYRAQLPDHARLPFADITLINKGSIDLLKEQSDVLFDKLCEIGEKRGGQAH